MTNNPRTFKFVTMAAFAALAFVPVSAKAQTAHFTAAVQVQNTLTLTVVDNLDFGKVAAISDATNTATLAIDPITDALSATTTGAPAVFAVVDNTTAKHAQMTVEDGADGAALNFTISNVTNPVNTAKAFTLTNWKTAWNGGAATARTVATPFQYTFASAFAAGVNVLDIGAAIVTQTAVGTYPDGPYAGAFDVIVSY